MGGGDSSARFFSLWTKNFTERPKKLAVDAHTPCFLVRFDHFFRPIPKNCCANCQSEKDQNNIILACIAGWTYWLSVKAVEGRWWGVLQIFGTAGKVTIRKFLQLSIYAMYIDDPLSV